MGDRLSSAWEAGMVSGSQSPIVVVYLQPWPVGQHLCWTPFWIADQVITTDIPVPALPWRMLRIQRMRMIFTLMLRRPGIRLESYIVICIGLGWLRLIFSWRVSFTISCVHSLVEQALGYCADTEIGISFLNAIWHSPVVRRRLACEISSLFKSAYSVLTNLDKKILDDVVFTVLATTSVLGDLREMPPCRSLSGCFWTDE